MTRRIKTNKDKGFELFNIIRQLYHACVRTSESLVNTLDSGSSRTNSVSGLSSGQTYFFAVTAYNAVGLESDFSTQVSYQVPQSAPPSVALSSPNNGATLTAPATVELGASVTANGNTIDKVQFYQGATLLGEDTTSPYTYAWGNVGAGSYVLSAKAIYGGDGTSVSSGTASVTVNNPPPTIALSAPDNGATRTVLLPQ